MSIATEISAYVASLMPILDSKVAAGIIGSAAALWTYRRQAKERIAASVAWRWIQLHDGQEDEAPFLVIQNMGGMPSYVTSARYRRGNFVRRLVSKPHVMMFDNYRDDSFPQTVPAAGAVFFRIEQHHVQAIAGKANKLNRIFHRCGRSYVWIELRTVAGRTLIVSAREGICPRDRPDWW